MTEEEEASILQDGTSDLMDLIDQHHRATGGRFDRATEQAFEEIIRQHGVLFKRRYGFAFPKLVPVFIVCRDGVEIQMYRRDLDRAGIEAAIVQLYRKLAPRIADPATELARAVKRAWPDRRPDVIPMPTRH